MLGSLQLFVDQSYLMGKLEAIDTGTIEEQKKALSSMEEEGTLQIFFS